MLKIVANNLILSLKIYGIKNAFKKIKIVFPKMVFRNDLKYNMKTYFRKRYDFW